MFWSFLSSLMEMIKIKTLYEYWPLCQFNKSSPCLVVPGLSRVRNGEGALWPTAAEM